MTYTLSANDLGHTIEVEEAASNLDGTSPWAPSAPTAMIAGPPPVVARPPPVIAGPPPVVARPPPLVAGPPPPQTSPPTGGVVQPITSLSGLSIGPPAIVKVGRIRTGAAKAIIPVSCIGPPGTVCSIMIKLSVLETVAHGRLVAIATDARKTLIVAGLKTTLVSGQSERIIVRLNRLGRELLARHHPLPVELLVKHSGRAVKSAAIRLRCG